MSNPKQISSRTQRFLADWSDFDELEEKEVDETVQLYDKMVSDLEWNLSATTNINITQEQNQRHQQRMNAPSLPQTTTMSMCRHVTRDSIGRLMKSIQVDLENIPPCLTKENPSFRHLLDQLSTTTTTVESTDTLRTVAVLIYKTMILSHYHRLWTVYLQSGSGELVNSSEQQRIASQVFYSTTLSIWPKQVRESLHSLQLNSNKKEDNEIYFHFVIEHLDALQQQLNEYEALIESKTSRFPHYTLDMRNIIVSYIQQHLCSSLQMKIEHEIELTRFDYHIQALKLEYLRHNPNKYQEQRMKEICRSSYEHETAEQQYHFLRRQIEYYTNSPNETFQSSPIGQSVTKSLLNLFGNGRDMERQRQHIFQQFQSIAEKARNDIFEIDLTTAEQQRTEYRKKYENNIKRMWSTDRSSTNQMEFLSRAMIQLITARCQNISERIECIYKFKANMKNI